MLCKVAKRNNAIKHRKHRDYPWDNLAEFLSNNRELSESDANAIENILQARFKSLWQKKAPMNTAVQNRVPYNGLHEMYVLNLDQYLEKMKTSKAMYLQCAYHHDALNDEFFDTEEYIAYHQNCFVVRIDIHEFKIGFTFMLRPFIFPKQEKDLWHAGSFYVYTDYDPHGWFYQLNYNLSERIVSLFFFFYFI